MVGGTGADHWLLIGNSRWHWARRDARGLETWHTPPAAVASPPVAWAAVGEIPAGVALPPERRLSLAEVPLRGLPSWLGIDRALAGWLAWSECRRPVLVADAGTVLSFTRVDAEGRFRGGRLMAGVGLQLRAMAAGTERLPAAGAHDRRAAAQLPGWPVLTAEAMVAGVERGLAAALAAAIAEVLREQPSCRLILTGGDAPALLTLLSGGGQGAAGEPAAGYELRPDLCLEALVRLRPGAQASSRSLRI